MFAEISFVFLRGTPVAFLELTFTDFARTPSALRPVNTGKPPPERSRAYKALCDWEGIADLCLTKVAKGATVKPPFGATCLILQCFARKFLRAFSGVRFVACGGTPVVFFELIFLDFARA